MFQAFRITTIFDKKQSHKRSVALEYLRAFIVILVVIFHSFIPYEVSSHFDISQYLRSSGPIVDKVSWIGFDCFSEFVALFFMPLIFLLSGVFVWPSLRRRGAAGFLRERLIRLGVPYVVGLIVLMPPAYYPSFRMSGGGLGLLEYWWSTVTSGPRPNGPIWFIGVLLVFDTAAATMHRVWPDWSHRLAQWIGRNVARPAIIFAALFGASVVAYVPLLLRFGPARWLVVGTVLVQASTVLLYAVYFGAGVAIGRAECPLLSGVGELARGWWKWLIVGAFSYLIVLVWSVTKLNGGIFLPWQAADTVIDGITFSLACCAISFACLAIFLRFSQQRIALFDSLAANAYGIFLVHFVPMVWLQYALLSADLPAGVKATLVLAGTLSVSWSTVAISRRILAVRVII